MKRKIAIMMVLVIALSLAACGNSTAATGNGSTDPKTEWRMTSRTSENGTNVEKLEYVYDEDGMPTEIISYLNGEELMRSTPTHDEKGQILTCSYIISGMTYEETATYNENGKALSVTQNINNGQMFSEVTYTYDDKGNMMTQTSKSIYDMGDGTKQEEIIVTTFTYDDKGNQIRQDITMNGQLMAYAEISYNTEGKVIQQASYSSDGTLTNSAEIAYEGNKAIQTTKMGDGTVVGTYTRVFDEHENVIEMIVDYSGVTSKETMTWQEFPAK